VRIYLTHRCAEKDPALRGTGEAVTPDKLYTDAPIQRFMAACKRCDVKWAIFSDLYGVWFPDVTHEWYEKGAKPGFVLVVSPPGISSVM